MSDFRGVFLHVWRGEKLMGIQLQLSLVPRSHLSLVTSGPTQLHTWSLQKWYYSDVLGRLSKHIYCYHKIRSNVPYYYYSKVRPSGITFGLSQYHCYQHVLRLQMEVMSRIINHTHSNNSTMLHPVPTPIHQHKDVSANKNSDSSMCPQTTDITVDDKEHNMMK